MFYPCILILDKTFRPLSLVSSHCFAMCAWQQHMLDVLSSLWCCTKVTHCSHYACELLNEMFESMCRRLVHVHVVPPTVAQLFSPICIFLHFLLSRCLNFLSSCWSIWAQLSKIDRHSAILFKYCVFCSFWSKIEQIMPAPSNPPFHICFFASSGKNEQDWPESGKICLAEPLLKKWATAGFQQYTFTVTLMKHAILSNFFTNAHLPTRHTRQIFCLKSHHSALWNHLGFLSFPL